MKWDKIYKRKGIISIIGLCGTGKTITAGIIIRKYIEKQYEILEPDKKLNPKAYSCQFWKVADILNMTKTRRGNELELFLNTLYSINFLVLDDVGAYPDPNRYLANIIDKRDENYKFTMITTNIDIRDWAVTFGERTASRLNSKRSLSVETADQKLRIEETGIEQENLPF